MNRNYDDLASLYSGQMKRTPPRKGNYDRHRKPYKTAEFTNVLDAIDFTKMLEERNAVYLSQHGLILQKEGEDTDRVGEYAWSNITGLSTPSYIRHDEDVIIHKSNFLFSSTSPSVIQVRFRPL